MAILSGTRQPKLPGSLLSVDDRTRHAYRAAAAPARRRGAGHGGRAPLLLGRWGPTLTGVHIPAGQVRADGCRLSTASVAHQRRVMMHPDAERPETPATAGCPDCCYPRHRARAARTAVSSRCHAAPRPPRRWTAGMRKPSTIRVALAAMSSSNQTAMIRATRTVRAGPPRAPLG